MVMQARPQRTLKSLFTAMLAGLLVSVLSGVLIPTAALAAYSQVRYKCNSGPAGAVCVRLFYDSVQGVMYGYGASDPNPGHWMGIQSVGLYRCPWPDQGCTEWASRSPYSGSYSHQKFETPRELVSLCFYWNARMTYSVDGVVRSAPVATPYYGGSC